MRIVVLLVLCALCVSFALAQGTVRYVPGGLAIVEGNSASADLFRTTESKFQQVYFSSEFDSLGAPTGRIDGITFRLDGEFGSTFVGVWPSVVVGISTTSVMPDSLSPMYSANDGADGLEVFAAPLFIRAVSSSLSPQSFEVRIPFSTPFYYDPSIGNLLVTILTAAGPTDLWLDGQNTSGDSVSRVFGGIGISGSPDTLGLITRFEITPIPEPKLSMLITGWFIGLLFRFFLRRAE